MDDVENSKKDYGPKKLSEESIASLILEMEKNKKSKPEDYITQDFVLANKKANEPKVYPVTARGH